MWEIIESSGWADSSAMSGSITASISAEIASAASKCAGSSPKFAMPVLSPANHLRRVSASTSASRPMTWRRASTLTGSKYAAMSSAEPASTIASSRRRATGRTMSSTTADTESGFRRGSIPARRSSCTGPSEVSTFGVLNTRSSVGWPDAATKPNFWLPTSEQSWNRVTNHTSAAGIHATGASARRRR